MSLHYSFILHRSLDPLFRTHYSTSVDITRNLIKHFSSDMYFDMVSLILNEVAYLSCRGWLAEQTWGSKVCPSLGLNLRRYSCRETLLAVWAQWPPFLMQNLQILKKKPELFTIVSCLFIINYQVFIGWYWEWFCWPSVNWLWCKCTNCSTYIKSLVCTNQHGSVHASLISFISSDCISHWIPQVWDSQVSVVWIKWQDGETFDSF